MEIREDEGEIVAPFETRNARDLRDKIRRDICDRAEDRRRRRFSRNSLSRHGGTTVAFLIAISPTPRGKITWLASFLSRLFFPWNMTRRGSLSLSLSLSRERINRFRVFATKKGKSFD